MANVCVSSEPHIPDLWRIPFEKPPATLMAALFVCAPYGLATRDTVVVRSRPLSLSLSLSSLSSFLFLSLLLLLLWSVGSDASTAIINFRSTACACLSSEN